MAPTSALTFLLVLGMSTCVLGHHETVTTQTRLGDIVGIQEHVRLPDGTLKTVDVYRGVPYARPPVGDLRFSKPQPAAPFAQPFDAQSFGPACPQLVVAPIQGGIKEDCLSLNIYVPQNGPSPDGRPLAVLVWIHGGAFLFGEGRSLPVENLAAFGDIVVVTVNYRLGVLGFLSTDDAQAAGNWGLWDQRLALQWVSQNIASFGGDPSRVTLSGFCAPYHALYTPHEGLFHRILIETASGISISGFRKTGVKYARALAKAVSGDDPAVSTSRTSDLVNYLRNLDYQRLVSANVRSDEAYMLVWAPMVDGDFMVNDPLTLVSWPPSGHSLAKLQSLDAMTGNTYADGIALFGHFLQPMAAAARENVTRGLSDSFFASQVRLLVNASHSMGVVLSHEEAEGRARAVLQEYRDWENQDDPGAQANAMVQLLTDFGFFIPNKIFTKNHANGNRVKLTYLFEFREPAFNQQTFPWLQGSLHGSHRSYGFGMPDAMLFGSTLDVNEPEGRALWNFSKSIMTYWSNFVKSGNPNQPNAVSLEWKPFTAFREEYMHMELGKTVMQRNPKAKRSALWLDYIPSLNYTRPNQQTCRDVSKAGRGADVTSWLSVLLLAALCGLVGTGLH